MRRIPSAHDAISQGGWPARHSCVLHAKTLGIIGVGRVGRHVARLATAFGMRVLGWSPRLTGATAAASAIEARSLPGLLRESDVVSIHAALNADSTGLIDAHCIALMKPSAYLINTARGAIVDETALVEALAAGRIAGAALDVFDQEPLPASHPLKHLANVVLTPHIGWNTDEGFERFAAAACEVLLAFDEGRDVPRFNL
jgi:phosphoglycerate dehydrogenase-like enzyme